MTFDEAIKKLHIEKYGDRIWNSNSKGELFHIPLYIKLAETIDDDDCESFAIWFDDVVKYAEENSERPESVFQHIDKFLEVKVDDEQK